jgi:DNA-binding HxlR family transcriptional regulator
MYERKLPEILDCGIYITMKVLGGKWQPCIIDAINTGIRRPSEMHRYIDAASPRVINMQLRELESHGLVTKTVFDEVPLKVEYYLTPLGRSILPVIEAMNVWGDKNKYNVLNIDVVETEPVMETASGMRHC